MADLTQEVAKSHMLAPHQDGVKEKPRSAAIHPESAIHAAADKHLAQLSVAARYAFAMGRKALGKNPANAAKAAAAIKAALLDVLPSALLKPLAAGGQVALDELPRLKAAGDVEGHEFHGNQWTSGSKEITQGEAQKEGVLLSAEQSSDVASGRSVIMRVPLSDAVYNDEPFDPNKAGTAERVSRFVDTIQKGRSILALDGYINTEGKVEVAEGHHRLAALKVAGKTHAIVTVAKSSLTNPWKVENGLRANGDVEGHEFHGNQWRSPEALGSLMKLHDSIKDHPARLPHSSASADSHYAKQMDKLHRQVRGYLKGRSYELGATQSMKLGMKKAGEILDAGKTDHISLDTVLSNLHMVLSYAHTAEKGDVRVLAAGPLTMKFDVSNPAAVAWAKEHAGELAVGISETTEQAIKDAVAQALESGDDPTDAIEAAVGDADRADLIARTEVMTAANEGQRQAWDQATEAGLLTGDEQAVWIATEDACPECEALDGETRSLDGEYPDDGGDGPPLHPNCRCTEGIQ